MSDAETLAEPAAPVITRTETIAEEPAESLAAVFDIDRPLAGHVPPLWHWLYLLSRPAQADLGPDGHPLTGIPAPPASGHRRMFAGGRVRTLRLLRIGEAATRTTRVLRTAEKTGRSGPLTIVTVGTEITQDGEAAIVEEQDIVYRPPAAAGAPASSASGGGPGAGVVPGEGGELQLRLPVGETLLFRFSALTFNAHRIHYDREWSEHEGYDDLVVHGPLQAVVMAEVLRRGGVDLVNREFAFRLVSPMIGPQTLEAQATDEGPARGAHVRSAAGQVTAVATLG